MINIGIIGTGFIAQLHLDAYQKIEGVSVRGVFDNSTERAEEFVGKLQNAEIFKSAEELVASPNIDVVVICVPTYLHEQFIDLCVQHKKHIFCEKPLALSLEVSKRIIERVKNANIKMMVGHVLRFWPEYVKIKELVDSKKLGAIKAIYASRLGQMPTHATWFADPKKSGGALYDLHIHDIDFISYLFGMPKKCFATGYKSEKGAWNHIFSNLIYDDFPVLIEGSNQLSEGYPFTMSFRIVGTEASVEYLFKAGVNLEDIASSKRELIIYQNYKPQNINIEIYDAYNSEISYFIDELQNNGSFDVVSHESVLNTMNILELIEKDLEQ